MLETATRQAVIARRQRLGWTQRDLAVRLRKTIATDRRSWATQTNVSRYESLAIKVDLDIHAAFLAAVGLSLADAATHGPLALPEAFLAVDPLVLALEQALAEGGDRRTAQAMIHALREQIHQTDTGPATSRTRGRSR